MEHLPHLYCIDGDPAADADGLPQWWPCSSLAAAADRLAAVGRWLPRHTRRRLTLRFLPGGNTAAPGPERVFRLAHGTPGLTEFNPQPPCTEAAPSVTCNHNPAGNPGGQP